MMSEDMRILIVEDDEKIASFIVKGLKQDGYAVDHCTDGERAVVLAQTVSYDAVVVDLMLPKLDGLSLIRLLRARGIRVPVLILSAKVSVDDRVRGLQAGGDDYLTKPFAFSELLARVQALIRRATQAAEPARLTVGDLTLDLLTREVRCGGGKIDLQPREFSLLEYLLLHQGQVVTRTMLLSGIWNYHFDPKTHIVETHMSRMRAKVGADLIQTVRGSGYIARAPKVDA
jgi:two-component system OmpR family response regulator